MSNVEVIEAGPTGTFGAMMDDLAANESQRVVGGFNRPDESTPPDDRPLDELTVKELHQEAESIGVEGHGSIKRKDDLIKAISDRYDEIEAEADDPEGDGDPETGADGDPDGGSETPSTGEQE